MTNNNQMNKLNAVLTNELNASQTIVSNQPTTNKENKMENTLKNNKSDLNFELRFSANDDGTYYACDVILQENPEAKFQTVKGYQAGQFASWLTYAFDINGNHYADMSYGHLLSQEIDVVKAMKLPHAEGFGYLYGEQLMEAVEAGTVKRAKEIDPEATYRLLYNGIRVTAAELPYIKLEEGEEYNDWQKHDMNARALVESGVVLHNVAKLGYNVRLVFFEKSREFFGNFQHMYSLFEAGKLDELAKYHNILLTKGALKNGLRQAAQTLVQHPDKANTTELKRNGETTDYGHLIGKTCVFGLKQADGSHTIMPGVEVFILNKDKLAETLQALKTNRSALVLLDRDSVFAPQADVPAPVAEAPVPTRKHRRNALVKVS